MKKPENHINNVAYYKKKRDETKSAIDLEPKPETTTTNKSIVTTNQVATDTILTMPSSSSKSWSQIAGKNARKNDKKKNS